MATAGKVTHVIPTHISKKHKKQMTCPHLTSKGAEVVTPYSVPGKTNGIFLKSSYCFQQWVLGFVIRKNSRMDIKMVEL